jgi:phosphoadenosine phosphosulfate reductase
MNLETSRIKFALQGRDPPDAELVVKRAIEWFQDKLVVSCSFGRCSVVVLHMALKYAPRIRVVFNDTGVEYPETYAYKRELTKLWNLNLVEVKPIKSFWACVKEYGLPQIRGEASHKTQSQPFCCYYLKERPMVNYCHQNNIEATLTGLRAAESRVRLFAIQQYGNTHFSKKTKRWNIHAIAYWTQQQVIEYMKEHGIPVNPIYAKLSRSGCMPCTAFRNWEHQLSGANPKMYAYIQHMKGVSLIPDYFQPEPPCLTPQEI